MVRVLVNLLEYLGYKIYAGISCVLPLSLAYFLADLIGYIVCIFTLPETMIRARIIQKIKDSKQGGYRLVIKNTQYFNRDLVDFFRSGRLDSENIDSFVEIKGLENLDDALARDKGAVLASSHLGSWEMSGICLAIKGYPIYGMVWEARNKWVARMLEKVRSKKGVGTVNSNSIRDVLELLKENNGIGIMIDMDGGNKGIPYELWGYNVRLPRGPVVIASKTGAGLLVVSMIRRSGGGYRMFIEKPLVTDDEKNTTIGTFEIIKKYIQQEPIQWHWLKYFWRNK